MKKIAVFFVVAFAMSLLYLNTGLGFKFTEIVGSPEARAIKYRFSDDIIVQPAIIDYQIENGYAFGFRLPAYEASCENSKYTSSLLSLEGMYFVLNLNNDSYVEFNQSDKFYKHLSSKGLNKGLNLSPAELDNVVATYDSRYKEFEYFDTCKPL